MNFTFSPNNRNYDCLPFCSVSGYCINTNSFLLDKTVLSDRRKRMMYDAGLYDHDDEEDEVEVCIFMPLPRFQAFISYSRANFICFL